MNKLKAAIMLMALATGMAACKIGKKPTRKDVTVDKKADTAQVAATMPPSATPVLSAEKQQLIARLQPMWQKQISFSTFSGKAKMHYDGKGQKHEFTANFRIRKDEVIWASINAFVLQVARVYITPDSIQVVNYLQREVVRMHIREANKLLPAPMDFAMLQNFIVGNALRTAGNITDATDFGGTWSLQAEEAGAIQQATYNKADTTMRSLQLRTPDNSTQGMIQYGGYEAIAGRKFANTRALNLTSNGEQYYLDMDFNNVTFDQQVDVPFSIPRNYKVK